MPDYEVSHFGLAGIPLRFIQAAHPRRYVQRDVV